LVKHDTLLPFHIPCALGHSISRNKKHGTPLRVSPMTRIAVVTSEHKKNFL